MDTDKAGGGEGLGWGAGTGCERTIGGKGFFNNKELMKKYRPKKMQSILV